MTLHDLLTITTVVFAASVYVVYFMLIMKGR